MNVRQLSHLSVNTMAKNMIPVIVYYLNFANPSTIHWTDDIENSTETDDIESANLFATKYGGKVLGDKIFHVVKYKRVKKGTIKSILVNLKNLK